MKWKEIAPKGKDRNTLCKEHNYFLFFYVKFFVLVPAGPSVLATLITTAATLATNKVVISSCDGCGQ